MAAAAAAIAVAEAAEMGTVVVAVVVVETTAAILCANYINFVKDNFVSLDRIVIDFYILFVSLLVDFVSFVISRASLLFFFMCCSEGSFECQWWKYKIKSKIVLSTHLK